MGNLPVERKITGLYQPQQSLGIEKAAMERKHQTKLRELMIGHLVHEAKQSTNRRIEQVILAMQAARESTDSLVVDVRLDEEQVRKNCEYRGHKYHAPDENAVACLPREHEAMNEYWVDRIGVCWPPTWSE